MNTTINISLPRSILQDAKKHMARRGYASISEFIRAAIRKELYPELTENGFTPEFEAQVLKAAAEPRKYDVVWDGKTPFSEFVLKHTNMHGKNKLHRKLPRAA